MAFRLHDNNIKIYIVFSGGLCIEEKVKRIPFVGEPFHGEIVNKVTEFSPPRNGYSAYVWLEAGGKKEG